MCYVPPHTHTHTSSSLSLPLQILLYRICIYNVVLTKKEVMLLKMIREFAPMSLPPNLGNSLSQKKNKWYSNVRILEKLNTEMRMIIAHHYIMYSYCYVPH